MKFDDYKDYNLDNCIGMTHSQHGRLYTLNHINTSSDNPLWIDTTTMIPWHHWSLSLPLPNTTFYDNGYCPVQLINAGQVYRVNDGNLSNLYCTAFDGSQDSYLFSNSVQEELYVRSYTVSVWIKVDRNFTDKCSIIHRSSNYGDIGDTIDLSTNSFSILFFGTSFVIDFDDNNESLSNILTDHWCHVLYGVDTKETIVDPNNVDMNAYLYINGICYHDTTQHDISHTLKYISDDYDWYVGLDVSQRGTFYGLMEDLRYYDRKLTTQEKTYLYNQGRGTSRQCIFNGFPTFKEPKYWFKGNEKIGTMIHQTGIKTNEVIDIHNVTLNQDGIVDSYPYLYPDTSPPQYQVTRSIEILQSGIYLNGGIINDSSQGTWSFSTWLHYTPISMGRNGVILCNFDGIITSSINQFCIYIDISDNLIYLNYYDGANNQNIALCDDGIPDEKWTHVTFVSDFTEYFRYNMYINSILCQYAQLSTNLDVTTSISIGDNYSGKNIFKEKLQDTRIYNYALSYQEVKNIYNNGHGIYY